MSVAFNRTLDGLARKQKADTRVEPSGAVVSSVFASQELAHGAGVTHEKPFNVSRAIAGFRINLPQERRGVLVCSRREVKDQSAAVKTAAVHRHIVVLTAQMTE